MKGWPRSTVGDACEITSGGTPSKKVEKYWVGGTPWVSAKDLKSDRIADAELHISDEAVQASATKIAPTGSLLILVRGMGLANGVPIGEVTSPVAFNQDIRAIQPPSNILPRFLLLAIRHALASEEGDGVLSNAAHGTLKIDTDALRRISFPIPPTAEQRRIVAILDEAFEGIAAARASAAQSLESARDVFKTHLQSLFARRGPEWTARKVPQIAEHSLGKMLDKAKNKGELKPYLRNLNVRWFGFDLSHLLEMAFLPEEKTRYTAVKGDVLVCEGGYPGRSAIWANDEPIYFQKALHRVRFREPEHAKWFVYYLFAQDGSGALRRQFSGTGIQHFTGEALARFEVPLPPPRELRDHLETFDQLAGETSTLDALYTRKLAALDELKQSLLHQAFSGNL